MIDTDTDYPIQAVILAGGLATRLYPMTQTIPKSMVSIQGVPFVDYQLKLLRAKGFKKILMLLGYLGDSIKEFVGNGTAYGLDVTYHDDGEKPIGTAAAIKKAADQLEEHFFLLYGDTYLTCDYKKVFDYYCQSKKKALMTVYHNRNQFDKSNILYQQDEIIAYSKAQGLSDMHHIDYGVSIFSKSMLEDIPDIIPYDLEPVFQRILQQKELAAFEVQERFYEIGTPRGIDEFTQYLTKQEETL